VTSTRKSPVQGVLGEASKDGYPCMITGAHGVSCFSFSLWLSPRYFTAFHSGKSGVDYMKMNEKKIEKVLLVRIGLYRMS
jgi:hypothetical protein